MARRRTCYELYVNGRLAARGDIDLIADTLYVSADTAQRMHCKGHAPKGVKLVPLPVLYECGGVTGTSYELAERFGVKPGTVVASACRGGRVKGNPIRKVEREEFSVGAEVVEVWRRNG